MPIFFNAALFNGRQIILPEELEDADTEASAILDHKSHVESIEASRDNIKIRKTSLETMNKPNIPIVLYNDEYLSKMKQF